MPISGQNVGRDVSWQINTAQGQLVFSQNFITSFEPKPMARMEKYLPVSNIINTLVYHEGWEIEMEIARIDDTLDAYWSEQEAAYFAGVNIPSGSIYETITEDDGSVSQYVYTNVQLKVDTMGVRKGNEYISQKLSGYASRRERLT